MRNVWKLLSAELEEVVLARRFVRRWDSNRRVGAVPFKASLDVPRVDVPLFNGASAERPARGIPSK
jgi:hypothetical protein